MARKIQTLLVDYIKSVKKTKQFVTPSIDEFLFKRCAELYQKSTKQTIFKKNKQQIDWTFLPEIVWWFIKQHDKTIPMRLSNGL